MDYLEFAIKTAKEAAKLLLKMQTTAKKVTIKDKGDYALDADIKSEKYILTQIRKNYPTHDILTEETGHHHKKSDYLWIIDPLEGTLNYAHKLPIWAVNIGLYYKGEPSIGVVYAPLLNELFYAQKGKGTYLNGKKIHVNNDTELIKSFFVESITTLPSLQISPKLIRKIGCGGIELAYVAAGRFTAKIKAKGQDPYGFGPGNILVTEAGGKITDIKGNKWNLKSEGAISSNGKIHDKLIKLING
jgi:myo-inositol-1(or 4)-monophosphatase